MKTGKAYAFFNCNASKIEIEAELPTIKKLAQTPNQLEISLMGMTKNTCVSPFSEPELSSIIRGAREAGIRYVIKANYPNSTNKATADELSMILNQAYHSPLYKDKEKFVGEIVYKEKGKYIFRK